ncbi:BTAD domain-containing putative transcriptional regulator [Streptomyces acidiscabies]|uniref:AfsR/SARP family transcriptional regulator n=1 Tax=Streptomyces acidiscabies TaxID=42234 RepID=UPI0038F626C5
MEPVFRVLGPLRLTGPQGRIRLPAGRERVVVAQLILNTNKVLSVERLANAVWNYDAPSTARTQIQICISRLRRAFDAAGLSERIVTSRPGYQLVAEPGEVDLLVFEREVSEALRMIRRRATPEATAEGVALARRALGLFTGEPLADVSSEVVQSVARQLAQRRLHVLEACLDAQLDLGQAADIVDEIAALVAEHPLHGRLRALSMKALQRLGRRADAIAVYQEALREYRDQLGLEPDPELRQLHETILQDMSYPARESRDPEGPRGFPPEPHGALRPPALGRELLPMPGTYHLDGRTEEFRTLREALRRARSAGAGRPGTAPTGPCAYSGPVFVSVSGPRGIGKTAFAIAAAVRLAPDYPDGRLYHDMRREDGTDAGAHTVLATFLRTLGVPSADVPPTLEERSARYRELLRELRVLVVLDGAQDCQQVLPLLTDSSGSAVILVSRVPWAAQPAARRIRLGHLDMDASVSFLVRLVGAARVFAEPEAARRLAERCAGHPLALTALACRLNRRAQWPLSLHLKSLMDDATLLDQLSAGEPNVRAALQADYDDLRPTSRLLLQRLVLRDDRPFSPAVVDALLGCPPGAGMEVLDDLVMAGLVDVLHGSDATETYRLTGLIHLLIRAHTAPHSSTGLVLSGGPSDG